MVCKYGMSEKLGPITYGDGDNPVFLGRDIVQKKDYSPNTAKDIDEEIKLIITDAYNKAKKLLEKNFDALNNLSQKLLEKETLTESEIGDIIGIIPHWKKIEKWDDKSNRDDDSDKSGPLEPQFA